MRHVTAYDVLIVGAGHAGAHAAIALRQGGFAGTIGMIGDEAFPPYERPPLSKEYLAGEKDFDRLLIRPANFWAERGIDLLLGHRATAILPAERRVLAGGATLGYGKLIWCTGGVPRKLGCSGSDAANVHSIRTRNDVDSLVAQLAGVTHVTVIGGGYIGLEAAAALRKAGMTIVLLEALDRVLARVAGEPLSRFYEAEHRSRGVDVRTCVTVASIAVRDGRANAVLLSDGERIATDMVVVGIGIVPATDPLSAAGASGNNGIDVDRFCRTSLPDVYAIGDCAARHSPFAGGARIRIESVQNAIDQAKAAALHILDRPASEEAVPWFWSTQYDLKLQTIGLSIGYDATILRGDPASRSFSVLYLKQGRLIALDCVNAVKDYTQGRAHVAAGAMLNAHDLADATLPLKAARSAIA